MRARFDTLGTLDAVLGRDHQDLAVHVPDHFIRARGHALVALLAEVF